MASASYPPLDDDKPGKAYLITVAPVDATSPGSNIVPAWATKARAFSKSDTDQLYKTLVKFGFMVQTPTCKDKTQLEHLLTNEAGQYDYSDCGALLLVISGFGAADTLYCQGGALPLKPFIHRIFKADKCRTLAGKPKVVILQLCDLESYPVDGAERTDSDSPSQPATPPPPQVAIPAQTDFFFVVSNIPGHLRGRNPKEGSLFLSNLCKSFTDCPPGGGSIEDICTIAINDTNTYMDEKAARVFEHANYRLPSVEHNLLRTFHVKKTPE